MTKPLLAYAGSVAFNSILKVLLLKFFQSGKSGTDNRLIAVHTFLLSSVGRANKANSKEKRIVFPHKRWV